MICTATTVISPATTMPQPTRRTPRRRSSASATDTPPKSNEPSSAPPAMVPAMSSSDQMCSLARRWVVSARLLPSDPLTFWPFDAVAGSCRLLTMMSTESDRSSDAPFGFEDSSDWCTWNTAVRKIDRNVSVSTTASTAIWNAGRKSTACRLPLRASCSVRRAASSRRTVGSSSSSTARLLNDELS